MSPRIRFALMLVSLCSPVLAAAQTPTPPPAQTPAAPPAQTPAPAPPPAPLTIKIGDADFKLGGFLDAAAVVRSTNLGSGLPTTYGTIPFENTPQGHLHETRLSSQSSRANLLVTTKAGSAAVRGFLEIDFLGAGPGNAFVTANSHTPRLRHAWAQYTRGKFDFTGGQVWTLMTPNRTGLSPANGDVMFTQSFDPNLHLGLVWARQTQFRFVAHPSKTFTAGMSLENAQPFTGAAVVLPASFAAGEVDPGTNPGAPSPYPDIVGKIAFDPQTGKTHQHIEAAVLVRGYKTYSSASDRTFSATGTGFSVSAVIEATPQFRLVGTTLISDGGGRYMIGQAPDFMVNADGSITTIGSTSALGGLEAQINPKTMLYGYYGTVRVDQETGLDGTRPIGYGVPGATGANKSIEQTTAGANRAFFRSAQYGSMQLIVQYSYITRKPWSVPEGTPSSAKMHQMYVTVRYVLP